MSNDERLIDKIDANIIYRYYYRENTSALLEN